MVENAAFAPAGEVTGSRRKPASHAQAFGASKSNPLGDLQALGQVNQALARSLRSLFEPLLRASVKVTAEPIVVETFDNVLAARGATLTSFTGISMAPLSGQALLVLDGGLTMQLVDLYFGGTGILPSPMPLEFTPTAEAMIARVARGVTDRLAASWAELAQIEFAAARTDAWPAMQPQLDGGELVVRTRFILAIGDTRQVAVDILYPAASLKPVAAILSSKPKAAKPAADPAWTNELARAVMQVKLPVRSVLAEPMIPLTQLMYLKVGDIIPISFGPEIPLVVSGRRFARGAVGASNGRAAIRVNRIEPLEDEDNQ